MPRRTGKDKLPRGSQTSTVRAQSPAALWGASAGSRSGSLPGATYVLAAAGSTVHWSPISESFRTVDPEGDRFTLPFRPSPPPARSEWGELCCLPPDWIATEARPHPAAVDGSMHRPRKDEKKRSPETALPRYGKGARDAPTTMKQNKKKHPRLLFRVP